MKRLMIGCVSALKTKSLTNKVSNGDMANGTTGWQHYSNYSAESIVNGELKSVRNTTRPTLATVSTWGIATGHKVYIAAMIYGNKAGNVNLVLYGTYGSNEAGSTTKVITTTPTRYSHVITTATNTANGLAFDGSSFTTSGDYIILDNIVVIDLTAEFGAGNEPTAAAMDAMLAYLDGSFFDGTQQIIQAA